MHYFDNNGTTFMSAECVAEMMRWVNAGNPSSGYAGAKQCRDMFNDYKRYIARLCGIEWCCAEARDDDSAENRLRATNENAYKIIFTSGASEANAMIITGIINAYKAAKSGTPHVVTTAIEHKSVLALLNTLEAAGEIAVTYVMPSVDGIIAAESVAAAIRANTCLVTVMMANNETGIINPIAAIGAAAHARNVPLHSDTTQVFGKFIIDPVKLNLDAFVASAHKFHGPPGTGALIVKQKLLLGYGVRPLIYGTQNDGLRGGTENVPGIAAAYFALREAFDGPSFIGRCEARVAKLLKMRNYILAALSRKMLVLSHSEYKQRKPTLCIVNLSAARNVMCNTILLSIAWNAGELCNVAIKKALEARGIIVSIGSACNTSSAKASHVIEAIGADAAVRRGVLRISMSEHNTDADCAALVAALFETISAQVITKK